MEKALPFIPAKRYFTIGEVSDLCEVKPHVLRYWEQEFTQLRPMKRRGNRRYYQHHEVLMIRRIRDLLYDQGFTISGARNKLHELVQTERDKRKSGEVMLDGMEVIEVSDSSFSVHDAEFAAPVTAAATMGGGPNGAPNGSESHAANASLIGFSAGLAPEKWQMLRRELSEIRELLSTSW
jgi:DNA-binding transcriptional MerR regulator